MLNFLQYFWRKRSRRKIYCFVAAILIIKLCIIFQEDEQGVEESSHILFKLREPNVPLPYNVLPLHAEEPEELGDRVVTLTARLLDDSWQFEARFIDEWKSLKMKRYIKVPPPSSFWSSQLRSRIKRKSTNDGKQWKSERYNEEGDSVRRYFEYLEESRGHCKRIARVGGSFTCNINEMDGSKMVCFDSEFQIPQSKKKQSCLVLSFGISTDITFDEDMGDLNCKVHMFDMARFNTLRIKGDDAMEFHQIGLAKKHYMLARAGTNETYEMDNVEGIVQSLGLQSELIHILKIDIEGHEWEILDDLAKRPILDLIGQIAMEVHAFDMVNATSDVKTNLASERYNTLKAFEKRGFRNIHYSANHQDHEKAFVEHEARRYDSAGELLLINSNWQNPNFREEFRESYGYQFRDIS